MATANGWTRLTNVLLATFLGAATLGALACTRDTPTSPLSVASPRSTALSANSESAPFYYYFGQKIDLQVDPTRLVLDDSEAATLVLGGNLAAARARIADGASAALSSSGIQLASQDRVSIMRGHWLLHLPGASAATMRTVRDRLLASHQFRFVSPVYHFLESGRDFVPLNRLGVRFRSGVTSAQVDSLAAAFHLELIRPPRPDSGFADYRFRYPSGATTDPLTIAARLNESALVQWAEPDNVVHMVLNSVPSDPFFSRQYYLKNTTVAFGVPMDDDVEFAWDINKGGGVPSSG